MSPALLPLVTGTEVAFWICAPLMVLLAFGVILARKPVHSAMSMAGVMVLLAVLYASLDAPFLFVVQIIVYTGAVLMLFLFVMMLVGVDTKDSIVETLKGQRPLAILAAVGLFALLVFGIGGQIQSATGLDAANSAYGGNVQGIAALIFGRYVFVFELTSALLITAAVGAMVLAHARRLEKRPGQKELAARRIEEYKTSGAHPGPLPNSGVFATNNSIATPALLPDGSVAEKSVSQTLVHRGAIIDSPEVGAVTAKNFAAIEDVREDEE
ncbi:NADH-quinone oxidoreductase subunit J [Propionicicella superfundia]|uniref:NADH-quinone oxidoreductase subunit J n=1 Tax=Propionicicella superfundia TaxID=348582 RepID=UPI00040B1187|nr:NADH-quinone oxidoreductase subunit J [Propionicicella superfundia]